MSNYTDLTQCERHHFSAFLRSGKSISSISKQLGRDKSTLYREVNRNKGLRGYGPHQAHEKALYCLQNSHRYIKITQKVIGSHLKNATRDNSFQKKYQFCI